MIDYKLIRSKRRSISVQIDRKGLVTVHAPKICSEERIVSFLEEKRDWIETHVRSARENAEKIPDGLISGESIYLLGKKAKIVLWEDDIIRYDGENGKLYLPNKNTEKRFLSWVKDNAERILQSRTEFYAEIMHTSFVSVKISSAKTLWGCCTPKNEIRYSYRLLYCPKEVLDYVVIHELSHTFQKNHSKAFWNKVQEYCPDWKQKRKYLKDNGFLMEIF